MSKQIHDLAQETIRPGQTLEPVVSIEKKSISITADWRVRDRSAKEYFAWIKDRFKADYTVESETGAVLVLHKQNPGDFYTLEFRQAENPRMNNEIDVYFTAMAD